MPHTLYKRFLIVIVLLLATKGIGSYAITVDDSGVTPIHTLALPAQIGPWTGRPVKVNPVVYEVLRPDAVVQKRYRLNESLRPALDATNNAAHIPRPEVDTIVIYSRDVRGFHSPDMCLTTQGWIISDTKQQQIGQGSEAITLTILHAEKEGGHAYLAYFFADAQRQVQGWVPTLTKLVGARLLRRRVGAVQIQFAYDGRLLQGDGELQPQFSALMLAVTGQVQKTLDKAEKSSPS